MYVVLAVAQPLCNEYSEALRHAIPEVEIVTADIFTRLYTNFGARSKSLSYAIVFDPTIPARRDAGPTTDPDSGLRAVRAIRKKFPKAQIIVVCEPSLDTQFKDAGANLTVRADDTASAVAWLTQHRPTH